MASYEIEGKRVLEGEIICKGSKNSCLPILSACLICPVVYLQNVPELTDIASALDILRFLGCRCERDKDRLKIENSGFSNRTLYSEMTSKMRSSVLFAGALLGMTGYCRVALPGGCNLGKRPVDMHIDAFSRLGYTSSFKDGFIEACKETGKDENVVITLPFPSVGATENIMLASVLRKGEVRVINSAQEPEILDLADFLNKAGARISVVKGTILIKGVKKLREVSHKIIPDRIEAVTYMAFGAATKGNIHIKNCCPSHFESATNIFRAMGCKITACEKEIYLAAPEKLTAVKGIRTMPYPYFPTDAQSVTASCLLKAQGVSDIEENIFSSRFAPLEEFKKLGAKIDIRGKKAFIRGVKNLKGDFLTASDLRGGAGLVSASLESEGVSIVRNISHIERGYEDLEGNLRKLGAAIKKIQGE